MNIVALIKIKLITGSNAAKLLPSKISSSVVGVANKGSRVFSVFSDKTVGSDKSWNQRSKNNKEEGKRFKNRS